jgi:hypothetical protein
VQLLIILWVTDELRYDQFHARGASSTRSWKTRLVGRGDQHHAGHARTLAPALKAEIPEVELAAKVTWDQEDLLTVGDKANKEKGLYASPRLFPDVQLPAGAGQRLHGHLLAHVHRDLAETRAEVLRHRDGGHGQNHPVNNKDNFLVTGILRDVPENSR